MALLFAVLILFWCRDYMILRMGPAQKVTSRARLYCGVIFGTTALLSFVAWRDGVSAVSSVIWSVPGLAILIALQIGGAILCFWLKHSERHHRVWLVAFIPTPALWFFLANGIMARDIVVNPFMAWVICFVWIAGMSVVVARTSRIEMCAEDLDFAVSFAGSSNCVATFILAFSPLLLRPFA